MAYTLLKLDELEWSKPSSGDQSRGIVRLSDGLEHVRANIWRLPPGAKGRRHAERAQEEIFVVLSGTATMALGDPPHRIELPAGSAVIVEPGTAVQQRNESARDAVILAIGAPREESGNANTSQTPRDLSAPRRRRPPSSAPRTPRLCGLPAPAVRRAVRTRP
ncbi:MAG: cupin domain-containing protein [Actinobacteria bacterium]|nr:cupin domain-containing protein [Actinomycetota bacterium]